MARLHRIRQTVPGAYSFTVPAGVTTIDVTGWGGAGGGGGGSRPDAAVNSGGGAGNGGGGSTMGTARLTVVPGTIITYNIGAGGSSGLGATSNNTQGGSGGDGADTTFGSLATFRGAAGGKGGKQAGGSLNALDLRGGLAGTTLKIPTSGYGAVAAQGRGLIRDLYNSVDFYGVTTQRAGDGGLGSMYTGTPGSSAVIPPEDGAPNGPNLGGQALIVAPVDSTTFRGGLNGGGGGGSSVPGAISSNGGQGGAAGASTGSAGTSPTISASLGGGGGGGGSGGSGGTTSGNGGNGSPGGDGGIEISW